MKAKIITVFLAAFLAMTGCSGRGAVEYTAYSESRSDSTGEETEQASAEAEDDSSLEKQTAEEPEQEEVLYIDISGAVNNPGVYELPAGSRMFQAVAAAGGFSDFAETRSINQADLLSDGEKIYVYSMEEAEELGGWMQLTGIAGGTGQNLSSEGGASADSSGKVNLNLADKSELMTLSGVGEARAEAIISYRETHGAFASIEDIMNVSGIKEKLFEQIQDQITV